MRVLHDISTQLRVLNASFYNKHRKKGSPPQQAKPLPTPEQRKQRRDDRSPEQVQAERQHLLDVLNRAQPA